MLKILNKNIWVCPKCKKELETKDKNFNCKICKKEFPIKNYFIDFSNSQKNNESIEKSELSKNIHDKGYYEAISSVSKKYPKLKDEFSWGAIFQSGDGIFHGYEENMKTCLEINSGFGNNIENFSHNFEVVYSLDLNEKNLEIQFKRYEFTKRRNIILIRSRYEKLPFKDNFFDVVVYDDFTEEILRNEKNNSENEILLEIKRVMKNDGFFYFSQNNRNSFRNFLKIILFWKYDSNMIVFKKIKKILRKNDFHTRAYWSYPSGKITNFSGEINSNLPIIWIIKNLEKFLLETRSRSFKKQIFLRVLKFIPKSLIVKLFVSNFSSFLYCCRLNEKFTNSLETEILEKSRSNIFLTLSRRLKIIYIIFDKGGIPKTVAKIRKYSYESIDDISNGAIKEYKGIFKNDKRISFEKWIDGRVIDIQNKNEIISSIKKIFEFQNSTKGDKFTEKDIDKEVDKIDEFFNMHVPEVSIYKEWTKDYKKYLQSKLIFKTSIHGDLSQQNILLNKKSNEIFLIDWESSQNKGNPINDLIRFVFRVLVFKKQNKIEDFKEKIYGRNKKFNYILNRIQEEFQKQFGFKLNFLILFRIHILNDIIIKKKRNSNIKIDLELIKILKTVKTIDLEITNE